MKNHFLHILLPVVLLCSCSSIAHFDQQAYINSTSLKVDVLHLMDSAVNNYDAYQAHVNDVMTSFEKAYEYERNRPKNEITIKLWDKLKDTTGHLFGGFVARWKKEQSLRPAFIRDIKAIIDSSFGQISQLESGKINAGQVSNQ